VGKGGRGRRGRLRLYTIGLLADAGWAERADGEQCGAAVESRFPGDAAKERTGALDWGSIIGGISKAGRRR